MSYLYNEDRGIGVIDGIQDAVIALADAVFLFAGELLGTGRAGICRKLADSMDNSRTLFAW